MRHNEGNDKKNECADFFHQRKTALSDHKTTLQGQSRGHYWATSALARRRRGTRRRRKRSKNIRVDIRTYSISHFTYFLSSEKNYSWVPISCFSPSSYRSFTELSSYVDTELPMEVTTTTSEALSNMRVIDRVLISGFSGLWYRIFTVNYNLYCKLSPWSSKYPWRCPQLRKPC